MPSPDLAVELQRAAFRCVWLLVVGLHCVCAVYLTQLARVYHVIANPLLETFARPMTRGRYAYLVHAKVIIALLSALHWWTLLDIVWSSLLAKELSFAGRAKSVLVERVHKHFQSWTASLERVEPSDAPSPWPRALSKLSRRLKQLWRLVFSRHGVFGVESPMFHAVFTAREFVEIISQTFQAQRSSELLPRPWLNTLLVMLVVTNCWSTPVVRHLLNRRHQGLERVVCLFLDVLLNVGSCILVPLAVFLQYYRLLDPVTLSLPFTLVLNPVWFTRMVVEFQMLFSLATADVVSKLVQHIGIYTSLTAVVALTQRKRTLKNQHDVPGCGLVTSSWFASGYPCSVYTYSCYHHGTTSPDEDSWSHLDPNTLMYLGIAHCSELRMPRRFQSYSNLLRFQLYNNTLVEWGKESAISASKHPELSVVGIARTNLTGIPNGMLGPLPFALRNIQITHTNLTTLRPDLVSTWGMMVILYIEHSLLREFPKALASLPVLTLSLLGNQIEAIPELASMHQRYSNFVVSANPLKELPDALGQGSGFTFFRAERTLLKSVPSWLRPSVSGALYLHDTPYCEAQATKEPACTLRDSRPNGKSCVEVLDAYFAL